MRKYLRTIAYLLRHPRYIPIAIHIIVCVVRVRWYEEYVREVLFEGKMQSKYSLDKKVADLAEKVVQDQAEIEQLDKLWQR